MVLKNNSRLEFEKLHFSDDYVIDFPCDPEKSASPV